MSTLTALQLMRFSELDIDVRFICLVRKIKLPTKKEVDEMESLVLIYSIYIKSQ